MQVDNSPSINPLQRRQKKLALGMKKAEQIASCAQSGIASIYRNDPRFRSVMCKAHSRVLRDTL